MGFAKKSRKEAKAAQEAALRQQQEQFKHYMGQVDAYNRDFTKRNEGVIAMQTAAKNWFNRYNKGEDVASLNPAFAKNALQAAETTKNSMNFASRLGDNSSFGIKGDRDYQNKLNATTQANVAKGLAFQNIQGLQDELGNQRGILMDTTNVLNSDSRAGIGLSAQGFDMTSSMFNNATTKREMEMRRSQQMMGNLMGVINAGVGAFSTAFSGGLSGMARGAGGAMSAGTGGFNPMGQIGGGGGFNYTPTAFRSR